MPHHNVQVPQAMPEEEEEVHQTKIHHQVSNLLAVQVLGFYNVGAEVLYHYGILVPEACQGLLQVH